MASEAAQKVFMNFQKSFPRYLEIAGRPMLFAHSVKSK